MPPACPDADKTGNHDGAALHRVAAAVDVEDGTLDEGRVVADQVGGGGDLPGGRRPPRGGQRREMAVVPARPTEGECVS
jgi:hypothetical protein